MKTLVEHLDGKLNGQKVLIVVKPGSLDHTQSVIDKFGEAGWEVCNTTIKTLLPQEAKQLYKVHKDEDFYDSLCEYMSSGPCRAFLISNPESLHPFKDVAKIKDEIRELYGESDMRNVLHSSDSKENMENEASIFFQDI